MYDYLNTLKELEQKGTNYLIKLNLVNDVDCVGVDEINDDFIDMLYEFYIRGYWDYTYDFVCNIYEYCKCNDKIMTELSYEELYEYFKGEN